jgi:hypothetical protein
MLEVDCLSFLFIDFYVPVLHHVTTELRPSCNILRTNVLSLYSFDKGCTVTFLFIFISITYIIKFSIYSSSKFFIS